MNRQVNVTFVDATKKSFTFKTLRSLKEFCIQERDFWKGKSEALTKKSGSLATYFGKANSFQSMVSRIEDWESKGDSLDENTFQQEVRTLIAQTFNNNHYLWSGHPFIENAIDCQNTYGQNAADAFLTLLINGNISGSLNNKDSFYGTMIGYEFLMQNSDIVKRRNGEKVSLGHLRNQLADAKVELFEEIGEFKSEREQWDLESRSSAKKLYKTAKNLGARQLRKQDKLFDENLHTWSSTITELEKTYEEKLKLSKPADYWKRSARKYGIQGGLWSIGIVFLVVVGLVYFREFFLAWLGGYKIGIDLNTLQGIIILSSLAAIYIYLLRILSKLAFSSFHLMRDSEEREQLTYLYLSLSKESELGDNSRDIVLQALFSRTDTGLLAHDSGPSMPMASEALKILMKRS